VILGAPAPSPAHLIHHDRPYLGGQHHPCLGWRVLGGGVSGAWSWERRRPRRPISFTTTALIWAGNTIPAWGDEFWAVNAVARDPGVATPTRSTTSPSVRQEPRPMCGEWASGG